MTVHELKTWPEYFEPVLAGLKTFEIRLDDRGFKVGDRLRLREYSPPTKYNIYAPDDEFAEGAFYTGREVERIVTYICGSKVAGSQPLTTGYVVMGLAEPQPSLSCDTEKE